MRVSSLSLINRWRMVISSYRPIVSSSIPYLELRQHKPKVHKDDTNK